MIERCDRKNTPIPQITRKENFLDAQKAQVNSIGFEDNKKTYFNGLHIMNR